MDKKTTGIVAYITMIGWIVAFFAGDKEGAKFHLNQTLVLWILGIAGSFMLRWIPFIGGILTGVLSIFLFACWIVGFVGALQGEEKPMPIISQIKILN